MKHVVVIPGEGIGPEVILPTVDIISELVTEIEFEFAEAGKSYFEKTGESISKTALEKAASADAILFGATTSFRKASYRSPILALRQDLELYANVRPAKAFLPGLKKVDLVIIRENTEGLYTQNEEADLYGVTTYRRVSRKACEKIVKFAFAWGRQNSRRKMTCVHKANVLRASDGLFLDIFNAEASRQKKIATSDMLIDSTAMRLAMAPEEFDMIVTLNLYGDILSDLAAGLIGGMGFAPSANYGAKRALFEPAHGSAPDIAGKGIANPMASLLCGKMMLDYLGFSKEAKMLMAAIEKTVATHHNSIDVYGRCNTAACIESLRSILGIGEAHKEPARVKRAKMKRKNGR
ncbi:MAG: isocitrate/isopropylmalate dehydrogenase family protein [Thermoplasmata archaeon]|nr:isocitrate/isopropylmalate dehydrogenase family protein [Thermoplasmata archaeon]